MRLLLEQHALRHLQRDDVALAQLLERVVALRGGVGDDPHGRVAAVADAHVAHQVRRQRPLRRRLRRLLRCYLLQVLAAAVVVLDGERGERRGELLLEGEGGDVAPHGVRRSNRCRATPSARRAGETGRRIELHRALGSFSHSLGAQRQTAHKPKHKSQQACTRTHLSSPARRLSRPARHDRMGRGTSHNYVRSAKTPLQALKAREVMFGVATALRTSESRPPRC